MSNSSFDWRHAMYPIGLGFLIGLLLLFLAENCSGQSFVQVNSYPFVVTQVKYDPEGNEHVARQQGEILKNGESIRVFPVMFREECGLVGLDLYEHGYIIHISGTDSVQRVIRFDTLLNGLDTLLEVPYKNPFSSRHRGGGLFVQDSIVYASFGYGSDPADAQDLTDYRGKLVKINMTTLNVDIIAHGLRNPYRFDFNPALNEGFVTDVGTDIEEEINYFTGDYSLLNLGYPCFDGDSLILDPDTLCSGYAYSFPEYTYSQDPDRAIIGGIFWNGNYTFTDHYTGFGGHLTPDWIFEELPIPYPQYVTSMAVYPLTNTLRVSTWNGDIFEYQEQPLSIDTTEEDEDPVYPCRTCYNLYIDILGRRWSEPPVGVIFWAVRNSIVQSKLQYIFPY